MKQEWSRSSSALTAFRMDVGVCPAYCIPVLVELSSREPCRLPRESALDRMTASFLSRRAMDCATAQTATDLGSALQSLLGGASSPPLTTRRHFFRVLACEERRAQQQVTLRQSREFGSRSTQSLSDAHLLEGSSK